MSWNISEQEFKSVFSLSGVKRYTYFIKKVADWEEIWTLRNHEGWVLAADIYGHEVVPVWPHECFARACIDDEWQDCEPVNIELHIWLKRWCPGIANDGRQVVVFPTPQDKGVVVPPYQLCNDLSKECEQYE